MKEEMQTLREKSLSVLRKKMEYLELNGYKTVGPVRVENGKFVISTIRVLKKTLVH